VSDVQYIHCDVTPDTRRMQGIVGLAW